MRFEPNKNGVYKITCIDDEGRLYNETVEYERKSNAWIGERPKEWYNNHITAWQTVDGSPIM